MKLILFLLFLNFVNNELVVIYDKEYESSVLRTVSLKGFKVFHKSELLPYFIYKFDPEKENVDELITRLLKIPGVKKVTRNTILKPFAIPNDPLYSYQWHFKKIGMESAWDFGFGNPDVKVAILDDGFAYRNGPIPSYEQDEVISSDSNYHQAPDLSGINVIAAYDVIHGDSFPDPASEHGTHVLGTIAQTTNNYYGVAGIAPNISLILVQVLDATGGTASQIAEGIAFAVEKGAKIINMSLGGPPGDSTGMDILHLAIKDAYKKGVFIVCASGNSGVPELSYPAGYKECVAVGATDYIDSLTYYSQYGEGIELVAPGGDIKADLNNDGNPDGVLQNTCYISANKPVVDSFAFFLMHGTSMAAPHVTGVAALCLSQDSNLTNLDLRRIIEGTAVDLGEKGYDLKYGFGRIDAFKAVSFSAQSQYTVYPGDADANGVVDERDILPIGLYFGIQGPPRNMGDDFIPQLSDKWIPRMATFADCNGDGVIDEKDILTIGKNFGLTHTLGYFNFPFNENLKEIKLKKEIFYSLYYSISSGDEANSRIRSYLEKLLGIKNKKQNKISLFSKDIKYKSFLVFDITGRRLNLKNSSLKTFKKGIYFIIYKKNNKTFKEKRVIVK